ncbi:MAG: putative CtpA-like serine protease [Fimbriimonadales bacterium]|nr:putative CtpA-like serine protease [Fimbriimonadales bacterium]
MKHWLLSALAALAAMPLVAQPITAESKTTILGEVAERIAKSAYVGGADFSKWPEFLAKHKEAIDAAETEEQFSAAVNAAFLEFGFSHLRLLSPRAAESQRTGNSVGIGILAAPDPEGVRVAEVLEGGNAFKAGLKPGDVILKANGKKVSTPEELRGEAGTKVKIEVKRVDGTVAEFEIERAVFSLVRKDKLTWLDESTAVLKVHSFAAGYDMKAIDQFFEEASKAKKLILDLRGNGGGSTANLFHLAGKFMDSQTELGKFITRGHAQMYIEKFGGTGSDPVAVAKEYGIPLRPFPSRSGKRFEGAVAVLINAGSGSASEILAAGVQDTKRGKLVGSRTAGAVLASTFMRLSSGFSLQLPLMEYVSPGGKRLEGAGVSPDVALAAEKMADDAGVIKAAVAAIDSSPA